MDLDTLVSEDTSSTSSEGWVTAYLGLGASLGDRLFSLQQAVFRMQADLTRLRVIALSSVYESPHLGAEPGVETGFPSHLNVVAAVITKLAPLELLALVQSIEDAGGRQRGIRWSPRTIDIDILAYGVCRIETDRLTVPHARLGERAFVILPLREIAPEFVLPDGRSVVQLASTDCIRNQEIEPYEAMLRLST